MGVDTVICTVTGLPQLRLLEAACRQRVRRFAPAEFEGPVSHRPNPDPLDRGKSTIRGWLYQYRQLIQSTVFTCGVLYERFAPGSLTSYRLGMQTHLRFEGDFIVNPRNLTATAPFNDSNGNPVSLCLTSAQDVARHVVQAIHYPHRWPAEIFIVGQRMTVQELLSCVAFARGKAFLNIYDSGANSVQGRAALNRITPLDEATVRSQIATAMHVGDQAARDRAYDHLSLLQQRYDFSQGNTLRLAPNDNPMLPFQHWVQYVWSSFPVEQP